MYTNARSIVNKIDELRIYAKSVNPDVIAITESWTNCNISNHYLQLPNYSIVARHDRNDTANGRGGGILIYVKDTIKAVETSPPGIFNQFACIQLNNVGSNPLSMYVIYRSPNSSSENNDNLLEVLKLAKNPTIIVGDFNYPALDWENLSGPSEGQKFIDLSLDQFWYQHVTFPTHRSGNILDLLFAEPGLISEVQNDGQLGNSDHCLILFETNNFWAKNEQSQARYDYKRANWQQLRNLFKDCPWPNVLDGDINTAWLNFKRTYISVVNQCVPLLKFRGKTNPPWISKKLVSQIKQKRLLWRRYKVDGSSSCYDDFKSAEKLLKKQIRKAKLSFEKSLAANSKQNPKAFYAYIGSKRSNKTGIGPLQDNQSNVISDDKAMACMFNEYFSSVFEHESASGWSRPESLPGPQLDQVEVTELLIKNEMLKLKRHCSPGPDGIASCVLIEACDELAFPLLLLFKKSLHLSTVPDDWRMANITPIHKAGSLKHVSNYRPISLTSIVSKLLEKILKAAIMSHLTENSLLRSSQHGFMSKKSCLTNLLHSMEEVTNILDDGDCADILYLDFAKAFDKVQHRRLLSKLEALNIKGQVLDWIKAWLTDRKHRVVLNGQHSDWSAVPCSVPQGSVLGPPLFIIYADDMDKCIDGITALLLKFADDTKVIKRISSRTDNIGLQDIIQNLLVWAKEWQMSFNIDKCKIMHLGTNNPRFTYSMDGVALKAVLNEKDLGVIMEQSAKPSLQCAKAAQKANQVLGQLLRSFKCRDKVVMTQLYKVFVRPHLEYAVQAWCPYTIKDIESLEKVQKRFVRQITALTGSYEDKLSKISLTTLKDRRIRGDCIETFKMMHGFTKVDLSIWFSPITRPEGPQTRLSTDPLSLQSRPAHLDLRKNFFSVCTPPIWNSLPLCVRQSTSVNQFKNSYNKFQRQQKQLII